MACARGVAGAPDGLVAGSNPHMHGSRRSAVHVAIRYAVRRPRDVGSLDLANSLAHVLMDRGETV